MTPHTEEPVLPLPPTYVNYFFGNNGTGKTTVAKAIKSSSGVAYAPGKTAADYLPLVYDQDFIDSNMRNYTIFLAFLL